MFNKPIILDTNYKEAIQNLEKMRFKNHTYKKSLTVSLSQFKQLPGFARYKILHRTMHPQSKRFE